MTPLIEILHIWYTPIPNGISCFNSPVHRAWQHEIVQVVRHLGSRLSRWLHGMAMVEVVDMVSLADQFCCYWILDSGWKLRTRLGCISENQTGDSPIKVIGHLRGSGIFVYHILPSSIGRVWHPIKSKSSSPAVLFCQKQRAPSSSRWSPHVIGVVWNFFLSSPKNAFFFGGGNISSISGQKQKQHFPPPQKKNKTYPSQSLLNVGFVMKKWKSRWE